MTTDIARHLGAADAFELCMNAQADKQNPWTAIQDDILNDQNLQLARSTISKWPGYAQTPLHDLSAKAQELGLAALHFKDEGGRFGLGSFKALGGAYAVARLLQKEIGAALGREVSMDEVTGRAHPDIVAGVTVCCATDGNHGRSVAWGAQSFGCRCVIFIHATVSEAREHAIASYGAEVRRCAGNYDDSVREAQLTADAEDWRVVSDTSYEGYMDVPRDVMQGYEVMAAEAFDALDQPPTHIFLQTGVGGMAAAVAALAVRRWGADRPVIVLCDPDKSACWLESFRAGRPTAIEGDLDTLMAGLACGEASALAWIILSDHADAAMSLTDAAAIDAMRALADPTGADLAIVAGESAVAGFAGVARLLQDAEARALLGLDDQSRVLLFGTEGDTDKDLYIELVGRSADAVRAANP